MSASDEQKKQENPTSKKFIFTNALESFQYLKTFRRKLDLFPLYHDWFAENLQMLLEYWFTFRQLRQKSIKRLQQTSGRVSRRALHHERNVTNVYWICTTMVADEKNFTILEDLCKVWRKKIRFWILHRLQPQDKNFDLRVKTPLRNVCPLLRRSPSRQMIFDKVLLVKVKSVTKCWWVFHANNALSKKRSETADTSNCFSPWMKKWGRKDHAPYPRRLRHTFPLA